MVSLVLVVRSGSVVGFFLALDDVEPATEKFIFVEFGFEHSLNVSEPVRSLFLAIPLVVACFITVGTLLGHACVEDSNFLTIHWEVLWYMMLKDKFHVQGSG